MNKEDFFNTVNNLPAWDTHNHLDGSTHLSAQNFLDIGHYFWFCRELNAVGYPFSGVGKLPESEKLNSATFIDALDKGRNTYWNQTVRTSIKELFDIELKDVNSIKALNEKIAVTAADTQWAETVCKKGNIAKITIIPTYKENGLETIKDRHYYYKIFNPIKDAELEAVLSSENQLDAAKQLIEAKQEELTDFSNSGISVLRCNFPFDSDNGLASDSPNLTQTGNTPRDIKQFVGHGVYNAANEMKLHLQIFVGMASFPDQMISGAHGHCSLNDTKRIFNMSGIFDMYNNITFEIINASELNSLDLVQMARIFKNVIPGGLWWFNYRGSVFQSNMQYRFEALPACRSSILATDARCIEWAYIKTRFVKKLLAQFLWNQIENGWADEEIAIYAAKQWLYSTADQYYTA